MGDVECATRCGRPTKGAVLCPVCVKETENALAKLASWARIPARDGVLSRDNFGSLPSSPFDTPSGASMLGGAKALAVELDTARARQSRRGDQAGPRPAPGSKVWWPYRPQKDGDTSKPRRSRLDDLERDLTRAVQHWVATLANGTVVAPHAVVAGHALARACTWLLWHAHDITTHPQAGEAHRAFCDIAKGIEQLVDLPPERVYVGPCFQEVARDGETVECRTDLYVAPAEPFVTCPACSHVIRVVERRAWLADHLEECELTAIEACRALATVGVTVNDGHLRGWVTRGALLARGKVKKDGRMRATYRVGDVMLLAYKAASDPRAERRAARQASA